MACFTAIIPIIILSCCTSCVSTTFHAHSVPFLPQVLRGGSSNTADDDDTININNDLDHLVGIIDLRPSPNQDGIILLQETSSGDSYDLLLGLWD